MSLSLVALRELAEAERTHRLVTDDYRSAFRTEESRVASRELAAPTDISQQGEEIVTPPFLRTASEQHA